MGSDTGKPGPLQVSGGTLLYTIMNSPPVPDSTADVAACVAEAFGKWSRVSNFDFVPAPPGTPDDQITFVLTFDTLPPQAQPSEAAYTVYDSGSDTRTIIFDKNRRWVGREALTGVETRVSGIVWFVRQLVDFVTAVNLVALATHEIGHALGLDHSQDGDSIMQASMGVVNGTQLYFLSGQTLPDVDAAALAALYPQAAKPPVPVSGGGYAIVGSSFAVSNLRSTHGFRDLPRTCWGEREGSSVQLGTFYAYNPYLGTAGYAHLTVYLRPADDVGDRPYVVGGGYSAATRSDLRVELRGDDDTSQLDVPSDYYTVGTWGSEEGRAIVVGRATLYNHRLQQDTDGIVFLVVREPGTGGPAPAVLGGCRTVIGNKTNSAASRYTTRAWGNWNQQTEHEAFQARTWADERPQYDRAYSVTSVTLA